MLYTVFFGLLFCHFPDGKEQVPVVVCHVLDGLIELALDETCEPTILQFEVVYDIPVLGIYAAVDVEFLVHANNIANVLTYGNRGLTLHEFPNNFVIVSIVQGHFALFIAICTKEHLWQNPRPRNPVNL